MSGASRRDPHRHAGEGAGAHGSVRKAVAPSNPPRIAQVLLAHSLPVREREEVLGDMAESYARRVQRHGGRLRAAMWYWRHALAIPARLWWRRASMSLSAHEVRHAVRGLLRSPGFTAVAVLSLALGIGANTAIFSVVRSVLYTPLAVDSPGELSLVYWERPTMQGVQQYNSSGGTDPVTGVRLSSNYSFPIYERLRQAAGLSVELLGYNFVRQLAVVVDDQPAAVAAGMMVSGDYFSTLRLSTILGRPLYESDDRPDATRVAVISYRFWQRAFGGDTSVVGRRANINGTPFEIVGVTGPGFNGLSPGGFFPPTDISVPLSAQTAVVPTWTPDDGSLFASEGIYWVRIIARVPEGTSSAPIEEAMTVAFRESLISTSTVVPEDAEGANIRFVDGSRGLDSLRRDTKRPLAILAGVVAVVLLIACVNLASLMLARGAARQHELAVRRALGAGRLRLMRQLLLESLVLAAAGGVAGLGLALWSGPAITAALTVGLGQVAVDFQLDWALLGTVAIVSLAAAVLCGLLPALRLTRRDTYDHLRNRGVGDGGSRFTLGRMLIAAQIAVSIPLIVGAGLFLRTLGNLGNVDLGFDSSNLVIFRINPSLVTTDTERVAAIYRGVLDGLEAVPGVSSATLLENALLSGWTSNTTIKVEGEDVNMDMNAIGPGFFETMGIPMLSGRTILPTDGVNAPLVMVVNETGDRQVFEGRSLGRIVLRAGREYEIVGVVADSKYDSLQDEVTPTFYDSHLQRRLRSAHVLVRTSIPADRLERSIDEIVARVDPGLPATDVRSQTAQIESSTSRERIFARLLAIFGAFALLVACIGLYGVTSFAVARRRAEIGVRLALGARPPQILWLVLRSVLVLAVVGLVVGLVAAYLVGPVVGSMLYGLEPTDTVTLAGAALVMFAVALAAGWFPALRAARTDALIALSRD